MKDKLFRRLGKAGPWVSSIGYGCMGVAEFYGSTIPREDAVKLIRKAYQEYGVTFFDTADMYGKGLSESILGEAVKSFRDKVIVATKCGLARTDAEIGGQVQMSIINTPEYIKNACNKSLEFLNMDYIDVYYLHRHNPETPIEEAMRAMKELIQEGKIRAVGLSEVDAETVRRAHKVLGDSLVAVQTEYSFQTRSAAEAVLPTCRELGIGFVAYSPVARGLLTGNYRDPSLFGKSEKYDFRSDLPQFKQGNLESNLHLVDAVQEIAAKKGCNSVQFSLAWLLAQGTDIIPIPGTSNLKHLKENMEASKIELSSEDLDCLEGVYSDNPIKGARMP